MVPDQAVAGTANLIEGVDLEGTVVPRCSTSARIQTLCSFCLMRAGSRSKETVMCGFSALGMWWLL